MSTLFLIGNGFDVNCGMKTRYTDVYNGYVKEEAATRNLQRFKETISGDIENWGDFEMAMAQYAARLGSEEQFLECVRDFAKYMEKCLIEEMQQFENKLNNKTVFNMVAGEMMTSLTSFYAGISHNIDGIMEERNIARNIDVISFNYTEAFDVVLKECAERYKYTMNFRDIIHIHGVLRDGPVFGVDNIEQIKASYSLSRKGKRAFVKPVFNEQYDLKRVEKAKSLINNTDTICAYGMSLGESDLCWRNMLIEWLMGNQSNHLFIYRYNLSKAEYVTVGERMDIEEDAKERLLNEWGIGDEDSLYDQIHIPCGKNIFNIGEAIEREIERARTEQEKELKKTIKQGEKWIEEKLQDTVLLT